MNLVKKKSVMKAKNSGWVWVNFRQGFDPGSIGTSKQQLVMKKLTELGGPFQKAWLFTE